MGNNTNETNFFDYYFQYAKELNGISEAPDIFHRWSAIVGLGTFLGNTFQLDFGNDVINPNLYVMLIGEAGSRKSTSIKKIVKLLTLAGYNCFAARKTSREKYFMDLAGAPDDAEDGKNGSDILEQNLWGGDESSAAESFIAADEFNRFFQTNILDFVSDLGDLWDFEGAYKYRLKNSKSIVIHNPVINILGGNTQATLNDAFPPQIIGQGFFSRILMIYGERTGHRVTIPRKVEEQEISDIVALLNGIRMHCMGKIEMPGPIIKLLDAIYCQWTGVQDVRFDSYSNRRFTQLLKLCLIHSAARLRKVLTEDDVIAANTILTYAEHFMPKALGEFGKARHSDVAHKVLQILDNATAPMQVSEIFKQVNTDIDKITDLAVILLNLQTAGKIQKVDGTISGFLPRKALISGMKGENKFVDFSILTEQEREKIGGL